MGDPSYVADSTIIDAGGRDRPFTFDSGEDTTYQIIGLTLINGDGSGDNRGGSVYISGDSRPMFKKVVFKNNSVTNEHWEGGGAVRINWASAVFYDCRFEGNFVDRTGNDNQWATGGAIWVQGSDTNDPITRIVRCTFSGNFTKGQREAYGGAVHVREAQAHIINSLFYNNTTTSSVGGNESHSSHGAALYLESPATYDGSNNWQGAEARVINCTFVKNSSLSEKSDSYTSGGAISFESWGQRTETLTLFNTIMWGNTVSNPSTTGQKHFRIGNVSEMKLNNDYNTIQNIETLGTYSGDHSNSFDPMFTNSAGNDFTLSDASHLIGAGIAAFEGATAPTTDLAGNTRPNPSGSNPDIGAYENALSASPYPAPVKNLAGSPGGSSATLTWDANTESDLAYYMVAKSTTDNFTATDADTVGRTTAASYTVSGLENGTTYYFRVKAVNSAGQAGGYSDDVSVVPLFSGPVWYVAVDGSNSNEGSDAAPFADLRTAVENVSDGHTIVLKAGTYSGSRDRNIYLDDKNLTIKGEGAEVTILDGEHSDRLFDLSGGVQKIADMTIQRGWSSWESGAIAISNGASVEIRNVVFRENHSRRGGAVTLNGSAKGKFIDCVFIDNLAEYWSDNDGSGGGQGGAVMINTYDTVSDHPVEFIRCSFIGNTARVDGNNVTNNNYYRAAAGAVAVWGGSTNFVNCLFANNEARLDNGQCGTDDDGNDWCPNAYAGALASDASVWNSDEERSEGVTSTIINSTFVGNKAYSSGSGEEGLSVYAGAMLFWGRYDDQSGGVNSRHILFNNIIFGNSAEGPNQPGEYDQNITLHTHHRVIHSDHNLIQYADQFKNLWGGANDFEADPGFKDPQNGDFSLHRFSDAIEKGTLEFEGFTAPVDDITGKLRPIPPETPPDVGAYEQGPGLLVTFTPDEATMRCLYFWRSGHSRCEGRR